VLSPDAADVSTRGVLLVGASSPIGRAIAHWFQAAGDRVVGADRVDATVNSLVRHLEHDCSTAAGCTAAVAEAKAILGRLDVLILAAAVQPVAAATELTDEQWQTTQDTVLSGAFFLCRATLPHLPAGGSIVAISSVNATRAAPGLPSYAAAKAGLEGLLRQIALEYGPAGIRANAVAPGLIGGDRIPHAIEGYPLRRTGTPADVAAAVGFLASDDATFITGVTLPVDGGLSIASPAAFVRPDLRSRFLPTDTEG